MNSQQLIKLYQKQSLCNGKTNAKIDQQMVINSVSKLYSLIDQVSSDVEPQSVEYTIMAINGINTRISNVQLWTALNADADGNIFLQTINPDGTTTSSSYYTYEDIVEAFKEEASQGVLTGEVALTLLSAGASEDIVTLQNLLVSKLQQYSNSVSQSMENIINVAATHFSKGSEFVSYIWSLLIPNPDANKTFNPTGVGQYTGRSGLTLWAIQAYPVLQEYVTNFKKFATELAKQLLITAVDGGVKVLYSVLDAFDWLNANINILLGCNSGAVASGHAEDASYANGFIPLGDVTNVQLKEKLALIANFSVGQALILPTLGCTIYVIKTDGDSYTCGIKKHAYEWLSAGRTVSILSASGNTCDDVSTLLSSSPKFNTLMPFSTGFFSNDYLLDVEAYMVNDIPYPYPNTDKIMGNELKAYRASLFYSERLIGIGVAMLAGGDINERYLQDANPTISAAYRERGYGTAVFRTEPEDGHLTYDPDPVVFVEEVTSIADTQGLLTSIQSSLNAYLGDLFNGVAPSLFLISSTELFGPLEITDDATLVENVKARWALTGATIAITAAIAAGVYLSVRLRMATSDAYRVWQQAIFDSDVDAATVRKLGMRYSFLSFLSGTSLGTAASVTSAQLSKEEQADIEELSSSIDTLPGPEITQRILTAITGE